MNQPMWTRFCQTLGLDLVVGDPRFATNADRVQNRAALDAILRDTFRRLTTCDAVSKLSAASVPCADVRDLRAVFADAQVQHLGVRQMVRHPVTGDIEISAAPYHLSATPPTVRKPPPRLGEHTERWLREVGVDSEEMAQLEREGAI